ncbi:MAG: hypothetical protein H0T46_17280 [Deltaproteobacteria bacterium]|nr:hypothetical protein [Deltaproteobacteria bacterium]
MVLLLAAAAACSEDDKPGDLPDAPIAIDAAIDAAPPCAPITGAGTTHGGSVTAAETWTAAGSPHILPFDMSINAEVTIEACAVVRIAGGKTISVRTGGKITAAGTAMKPIRIEKADAAAWVSIRTLNGGTLSFSYTTIDGGGDPLNGNAQISGALDIAGTSGPTQELLHADHLTVTGSKSCGISLHDGGGFSATSKDVTISGSTVAPITTFGRHVGSIPTGTYTGNTENAIIIRATSGPEAIVEDQVIHNRGVPYRVGIQANSTLDVGPVTGVATLTIEPGVTLKFSSNATMRIDAASGLNPARGLLRAVGTAALPIVFTSAAATPAAGDWYGIWFGGVPSPMSLLDHVRVEYAGKISASGSDSCLQTGQTIPNDAAIRMVGGEPGNVFIMNTEIRDSARFGIDRGYRSAAKASFLPTNTFTNVAACKESYPRDPSGACPVTIPCP